MEGLIFFVGVPLAAGLVQFFLSRSRAPRPVKWGPVLALGLLLLVCFLAVIDCGGSAMPAGPPILRSPAWKRERPPRSIPT